MVVKFENNRCIFKNNWVETYQGSASEPYSYACPEGVEESHGIDGDPYFYYYLKGAFKGVNDGHFFGGVAAQTLHWHFKALFPNQQNRCDAEAGYCLNKIKQRVDVVNLYQSSWDGEFTNYAGGTIGSPYPHGSSLDIVAHEIGHAILEWNTGNIISDLNFEGELAELRAKRAALHESFADITAIAVKDYYARHLQAEPSDSNWIHTSIFSELYHYDNKFWGIGYDSRLANSFLRHVSKPRLDGISMDDYRDYEQTRGSHQRAGALNKLFYLISSSDGWSVQRAYRLVLKAMTGCFSSTADMYEASQCIVAVADERDKQHIINLAEQVGFVAAQKVNSQLNVAVKRMYGEAQLDINDPRISQDNITQLEVKLDEKSLLSWAPQSAKLWDEVKSTRHVLGAGEHRLSWHVELNDGTELESKRLLNLFESPLCRAEQNTERFISELSLNGQKSEIEAGVSEIILTEPVYKQSPINIEMLTLDSNVVTAAYLDKDRNGYFDSDSEKLINHSDLGGKAIYDLSQFQNLDSGQTVVRFVLSAQQERSSCTGLNESQVIDVHMSLNEGEYTAPSIDFGFKQKNNDLHLSVRQLFSNAYTFKWIFEQEEVVTSDYHIVKSMNQTSEVTLVLLRDGVEVNRLTKTVNVAPQPEISIDCQQNGTECKLSVEGELPSNIARFAWRVDEQHYTSSNSYLIYDFGTTGIKNLTVSLVLQGASVIFEKSQSIELKEVVEFDVDVLQENKEFIVNISKILPASYSLIWVVNGVEYPHSETGTVLTALSPEDSVSYILQKDGEPIFEKRIDIVHVNDPNLQISCQRDGLECKFLAEHQSAAADLKYVWDFGDGTVIESNAHSISHRYQEAGEYVAKITLVIDGRTRFTAQSLVKVDVKPLIKISFKQHNQTLSLSASGEVHDGMAFQWLINNEIRYGQTIDYDFPDKTQITSIKLTVYEEEQEVLEVFENIQVFESSGLDFKWAQDNSEAPLKFSFTVEKS
nr:M4 family metallopeptidase [Pseudoalteromonas luteoviolacea]